jgi:hypothetical protein
MQFDYGIGTVLYRWRADDRDVITRVIRPEVRRQLYHEDTAISELVCCKTPSSDDFVGESCCRVPVHGSDRIIAACCDAQR